MLLIKERKLILKYLKKMISDGLVTGTGGNISIYNHDLQLVAISPSSLDYLEMSYQDIVIVNLQGEIVEGYNKPTSELSLHLIFYQKREGLSSVVHTHSDYATILASLGLDIPPLNYYIGIVNDHSIRCAQYASFGSDELACNAYDIMGNGYACLLANHGLVACEKNLEKAYEIAQETERMAKLYYHCKLIREPIILDNDEVNKMIKAFKSYKQ